MGLRVIAAIPSSIRDLETCQDGPVCTVEKGFFVVHNNPICLAAFSISRPSSRCAQSRGHYDNVCSFTTRSSELNDIGEVFSLPVLNVF